MIELHNVTKVFPRTNLPAVNNVSLTVNTGQILVLVGPSGCGKTTILRMINRLIEATNGKIYINDKDTAHIDQDKLRKNIGYVIQQIGLFPHRTVKDNIALVPRMLKWKETHVNQRVNELLKMIGLVPDEVKDKHPYQLSGGQMQRVGVARALAADPQIMLMDEPFGAVDPIIRKHLQGEFLKLQNTFQKTIIFVTHDIDEAVKMGDTIVIMNQGEIIQQASPIDILSYPKNQFVINLLGESRGIKILDLLQVKKLMTTESSEPHKIDNKIQIQIESSKTVNLALEQMMKLNTDVLAVVENNQIIGNISWQGIKAYINKLNDS